VKAKIIYSGSQTTVTTTFNGGYFSGRFIQSEIPQIMLVNDLEFLDVVKDQKQSYKWIMANALPYLKSNSKLLKEAKYLEQVSFDEFLKITRNGSDNQPIVSKFFSSFESVCGLIWQMIKRGMTRIFCCSSKKEIETPDIEKPLTKHKSIVPTKCQSIALPKTINNSRLFSIVIASSSGFGQASDVNPVNTPITFAGSLIPNFALDNFTGIFTAPVEGVYQYDISLAFIYFMFTSIPNTTYYITGKLKVLYNGQDVGMMTTTQSNIELLPGTLGKSYSMTYSVKKFLNQGDTLNTVVTYSADPQVESLLSVNTSNQVVCIQNIR
jgi:hypothetical protein